MEARLLVLGVIFVILGFDLLGASVSFSPCGRVFSVVVCKLLRCPRANGARRRLFNSNVRRVRYYFNVLTVSVRDFSRAFTGAFICGPAAGLRVSFHFRVH